MRVELTKSTEEKKEGEWRARRVFVGGAKALIAEARGRGARKKKIEKFDRGPEQKIARAELPTVP